MFRRGGRLLIYDDSSDFPAQRHLAMLVDVLFGCMAALRSVFRSGGGTQDAFRVPQEPSRVALAWEPRDT
jgi:hypothetical protein